MTFTLPIVPPRTTAQMKRVFVVKGKPRFFKDKALAQAEGDYLTLLQPHKPATPLAGAVKLAIIFTWPHNAGTSAKRKTEVEPKTTRPDVDNAAKALIDSLVKLQFLYDDSQIARLVLEKFHGPTAGVKVWIEPF